MGLRIDFHLSVLLGIDAGLRINISLTKHFMHNFATPLNRFTVPNSIYNWEINGGEGWESTLVSTTLPSPSFLGLNRIKNNYLLS